MEFRWVALITLWTVLIGPIMGGPQGPRSAAHRKASIAASAKPVKTATLLSPRR